MITSLAIMVAAISSAQHFCYTTEAQKEWFAKHPELQATFEKQQEEAAAIDKEMYKTGYGASTFQRPTAVSLYTIPIVFHILHTGGPENISDAQVQDAVSILTRDFNKQNADTSQVVTQFKNMIGNPKFEFRLATRDPQGNCTNGIIRHWDSRTNWTSAAFGNYVYTWPPSKYLNVYVVKSISSGAAGYTYLPGTGIPTQGDAVVILSTYVGSIGTGAVALSRALSHEVGHWFNLPHVWGGTNNPGVACGDDGVSDTPITKGFSSCNLNNASICNSGVVENMQNYMDYAYCQRMFTTGQAARMQTAVTNSVNSRNNLSTTTNLNATGVINPLSGCIPLLDITSSTFTLCTGQSAVATSYTSNANPTSYTWDTDNNATIQNPNNASTPITFVNPGVTVVSCTVANASGSSIQSMTVNVVSGVADIFANYGESFESPSNLLPQYWNIINETTPAETWEVFPYTASDGQVCMMVPGEMLDPNSIEILESPGYDFLNNPDAIFSFKYAYAKQNSNNKDVFKVQASKNCGGTWTDVWVPSNTQLCTGSGGVTNSLYLNPQPSEWKWYDLTQHPNFYPFKSETNVKIRFFFQEDVGGSGYGNRFYLDEVNFTTPVGVNEITRSVGLQLYPNPSNGAFTLEFTLANSASIGYTLMDIAGKEIIRSEKTSYEAGSHMVDFNKQSLLAPGVYFVNMNMNGVTMSKKLVIN